MIFSLPFACNHKHMSGGSLAYDYERIKANCVQGACQNFSGFILDQDCDQSKTIATDFAGRNRQSYVT